MERQDQQKEELISLLQATIESIAEGVLVVDLWGGITLFNTKFGKMWRIPENILKSKKDAAALDSVLDQLDDPKAFLEKLQHLYANPDIGCEDLIKFKDGRVFERNSIPQKIGNTSVGRVFTFKDVTEHYRHKQLLEQRDEELRTLLNSTADSINFKDGQGRWLVANKPIVDMMGLQEIDYLGKTDVEIAKMKPFLTAGLTECARSDELAWQSRVPTRTEERQLASDGKIRYFDVMKMPVFHADGRRKALTVVARDITEHRKARLESEFLSNVSKTLASSLDYNETLGRVTKLAVPTIADRCVAHVSEDVVEGASNVDSQHSSASLTFPLLAGSRFLGTLELSYDESGRSYSDEDLPLASEFARRAALAIDHARLYAEAQSAIKIREEFISIASHELRTPLTALRMRVDLIARLMRKGELPADVAEMLAPIINGVRPELDRFTKLVQTLLDFSKICAGQLSIQREETDISELVVNMIAKYRAEFTEAGCDLTYRADENIRGNWDRLRIEQVITNLFSNALKFGKGKPVRVELTTRDSSARLLVRDHGIGISKADQERVFDRFERAVSERHFGGLGLGLYISRQLAGAHGGAISVESAPGEGATFIVELPR